MNQQMASLDELTDALAESLESSGELSKIRAHVRASVFHALENTERQDENGDAKAREKGAASYAAYAINEMFAEYLEFSGLTHTLSVFQRESGHPRGALASPEDRNE